MSTEKEYKSIETIRLEAELLLADYLFENELITESEYHVGYMKPKSVTLLENVSRMESPGYYYGNVHYIDFRNVWNNVEDYPTSLHVWKRFHTNNQSGANEKNASAWVNRALSRFLGKGKDPGVPEARKELIAYSTEERTKREKQLRAGELEDIANDYSPDQSIDGGRRRKVSKSGNIERASKLFAGDLYSDMSRIPPRKWSSWWTRFLHSKKSVPDDSSFAAIIKWTKHFILGYAIDRNITFEIWYNSYDSTFSVHDRYGNPVRQGERIPLMRDALILLFHNIAEYSPQDAEILKRRHPDLRRVNQDIANYAQGIVAGAEDEAARMADRKARIKAEKEKAAEKERERTAKADRAGSESRGKSERKAENDSTEFWRKQYSSAAEASKAAFKMGQKLNSKIKDLHDRIQKMLQEKAELDAEFNNRKGTASPAEEARFKKAQQRMEAALRDLDATLNSVNASTNTPEEYAEVEQAVNDTEKSVSNIESEFDKHAETAEEYLAALEREHKAMKSERHASKSFNPKPFEKQVNDEIKKLRKADEKNRANAPVSNEHKPLSQRRPDMDDVTKKKKKTSKPKHGKNAKNINENQIANVAYGDGAGSAANDNEMDMEDYSQNPLYHERVNAQVDEVRRTAETSSYTRQVINSMFLDGFVKPYDETRVNQRGAFTRILVRFFKMLRGRPEPIALPTKVASRRRRVRGFFAGTQARADFIIGYTINDKANFEIWYVQEISSDAKRQIASFYLYDVTAERIIESNMPHYRNAVQVLMLKIGSEDTGEA